MLETNVRIVRPGPDLYVTVRRATLAGSAISNDIRERACGTLRHKHRLAAVPDPADSKALIVAAAKPVRAVRLQQSEWALDVQDAGEASHRLQLRSATGATLVPLLVERALQATLARRRDLWTLDSPRIWYEQRPFVAKQGIAAYRRFETSAVALDDEGLGLAVDVGVAFFAAESLAWYFDAGLVDDERARREATFFRLTGRQEGQKGTLVYDNGQTHMKCYFESFDPGVTCATTGAVTARGTTYASLYDYYRATNPGLPVTKDSPAARVSFPKLGRPQWVAAERLRIRVPNALVPRELANVDKIAPRERRRLIVDFWKSLGPDSLGRVAPGLEDGFWRPDADRVERPRPPALIFAEECRLPPPGEISAQAYKRHYQGRLEHLNQAGCHSFPVTANRTLYCAYPKHVGERAARRLADDLAAALHRWSHRPMAVQLVSYESVADAVDKLRKASDGGVVVFVLNEERAAYHEVAFQLSSWRVKRITERTLINYYEEYTQGAWDRSRRVRDRKRGRQRWARLIETNGLEVLQLFDAVPYRIEQAGPYEAQLAIDVGYDRRFFALSFLVARGNEKSPSFRIESAVHHKADTQHEVVNPVILADQIVKVVESAMRQRSDPLESFVVFRDGRLYDGETPAIFNAVAELKSRGYLAENARVDVVGLHKTSLKSIRLWEVGESGEVDNPLEGTLVRLTSNMYLVAATGAATLRQGTAEPYMVLGNGDAASPRDAALAALDASHLNWSSPSVAQKLPLSLKRTDDELEARAAQEVRRLS
jgi:hypothetical protein